MPTVVKQPFRKAYGISTAMPIINNKKTEADRIPLLERKVDFLTKLLFEKSTKDSKGPERLYLRKTLIYPQTLQIELVSDAYFKPNAAVDIRFSISSKTSDDIYFSKRFRVTCNNEGSFSRVQVMTTLDLQKLANYADMVLSVVTIDLSNGSIAYVQDVVI
jgi:hypothetical protein